MNKQELIDKAVIRFKGKWASAEWDESEENKRCLILLKKPLNDLNEDDIEANEDNFTGAIRFGGTGFNPEFCEFVCLKSEYFKRSRELGYCNGYKYGVEYETNGKKPDLPRNVIVEIKTRDGWKGAGHPSDAVWTWNWDNALSFRIVDERYKPVEPKDNKRARIFTAKDFPGLPIEQTPEKSWHEKGELPPVGVECEYKFANPSYDWTPVKINYISQKHAIFVCLNDGEEVHTDCFTVNKFRPLKTEREKFVEAAIGVYISTSATTFEEFSQKLYDAGFKAPESTT